jgi:type II secretory pathway pseudopilin PulG
MRLLCHKSKLRREGGYMLLILMFFVALLTFAMMATLPRVVQQVKRDREEEMIHRGTEYARAVKKFYKKFNRYPNDLKELENTNNIRFIRRRYKDPMSKDGAWKLMHITDVQQGVSNPNFGLSQANNFNPQAGPGLPGTPQIGGNGGDLLGGGSITPTGPTGSQGGGQTPTGPGSNPPGWQNNNNGAPGDQSAQGGTGTSTSTPSGQPTGAQPGTTYGAGGIVGVESNNKDKSIREFGGKHNYNKWMFIYDPMQDRGGLLKGPYDPHAFQGGQGTNVNGQPGVVNPNGISGATPGQQNNSNNPGGSQTPVDPNAPPQ